MAKRCIGKITTNSGGESFSKKAKNAKEYSGGNRSARRKNLKFSLKLGSTIALRNLPNDQSQATKQPSAITANTKNAGGSILCEVVSTSEDAANKMAGGNLGYRVQEAAHWRNILITLKIRLPKGGQSGAVSSID